MRNASATTTAEFPPSHLFRRTEPGEHEFNGRGLVEENARNISTADVDEDALLEIALAMSMVEAPQSALSLGDELQGQVLSRQTETDGQASGLFQVATENDGEVLQELSARRTDLLTSSSSILDRIDQALREDKSSP